MPFYEYQCKSCGKALEAMQKINDAPLKKCPHCGKSQLMRLMSAPVFRLKGGGWYETDFKGDQDNKKNLADRPEAESAKDESKPAADAKPADAATGKEGAKPAEKAAEKGADKPAEKRADKAADKGAEKPAEKAAPTEAKKANGGISRRGANTPAKVSPIRSAAAAKKAPPKKPAKSAGRR